MSDYKTKLEKSDEWSMETKRLRVVYSEINARVRPNNITLSYHNSATHDTGSKDLE